MTLRAHESYGQHGLTPVDRLGVWLSQRAIHRHLPSRNDLEVLELGCGYRAMQFNLVIAGATLLGAASTFLDYQHVVNPTYDAVRGPVEVFGFRVHAEF